VFTVQAVLRIRIVVGDEPDPNFQFDADPDPGPDWHQNDAYPHTDTPQVFCLHMLKNT
jgi:hypothetical protein